jgi:hypothetical protein
LPYQDFGAGRHGDGDAAIDFGRPFRGDLIGLVGEQRLTFADSVAALNGPRCKETSGDGFSHGGDFDFDSHEK